MSKRKVFVVQCREQGYAGTYWRTVCTSFEDGARAFFKSMVKSHPRRSWRMVKQVEAYVS